jgi:hypothetical protein
MHRGETVMAAILEESYKSVKHTWDGHWRAIAEWNMDSPRRCRDRGNWMLEIKCIVETDGVVEELWSPLGITDLEEQLFTFGSRSTISWTSQGSTKDTLNVSFTGKGDGGHKSCSWMSASWRKLSCVDNLMALTKTSGKSLCAVSSCFFYRRSD